MSTVMPEPTREERLRAFVAWLADNDKAIAPKTVADVRVAARWLLASLIQPGGRR